MTQVKPYQDPARPIDERVEDLLARMTIEEKAGLMFHPMVFLPPDGAFNSDMSAFGRASLRELANKHINHFGLAGAAGARQTAAWVNQLQALAGESRLGIPATLSSDPRHGFSSNPGAFFATPAFSQWPEPPGLAAIGDAALVEEFADIARQEYLALGIRAALHPMADLATEPRWARVNGAFGEDAELAAKLTAAYIRGFQGAEITSESIACMAKHFPGGGPQKDGEDSHFEYGREQIYPGDHFDYHLLPFEAAFEAGVAMIMPYYSMPEGTEYEPVGFAYNKGIITGLLRDKYGFDGVVCTDWGTLTDMEMMGKPFPARAWGVEELDLPERIMKSLEAGIDQFGGEDCAEALVQLARSGRLREERLDLSARRLLRDKFRLGLFEQPTLDEDAAERIAGNPAFRAAGDLAQRRSIVLLKNAGLLPLRKRPSLYTENLDADVAAQYGNLVDEPSASDCAILRLRTPFEPRDRYFLEEHFHAGSLAFDEAEIRRVQAIAAQTPTIIDIYLERPAVMPELADAAAGLVANFGASDAALLDVLFGRFKPSANLPFELPSSMAAVRAQKPDLPHDSDDPLFPYGFGLRY
ncbi:MAG: glycoside hydrolase family 3 C-terminal domain-containing protein [Chloroflexota bacterium]|nr:glycoside hydrolase family 3 C-terminal domain-containing protein [Chloroflexota bacterium]